jgi:MoxR-like ATPase
MVLPDDVKRLVAPVLGHRVMLSPDAHLRGRNVAAVLDEIIDQTPVPVEGRIGLDMPLAGRG